MLCIQDNDELTSLKGLNDVESAGGSLSIDVSPLFNFHVFIHSKFYHVACCVYRGTSS